MTIALDPMGTPLLSKATLLAAALCSAIAETAAPEPCFCGLLPGAAIPIDVGSCTGQNCDGNGMAYVRLANTYPASQVGVADLRPGNCAVGRGFDLEVGVYRCYPLMDDGSSPPPDVMLEAMALQLVDEQAMRYAINCSDWIDSGDQVVGMYQPMGPAGGVLGGVIPLSAWIP